jgi:hypothetical protein
LSGALAAPIIHHPVRRLVFFILFVSRAVLAQPSWSDGRAPALNAQVRALLTVENSALPRGLYAAGDFTRVGPASTARLARWNGEFWSLFPTGPNADVRDLILFDPDGPGPAPDQLIAAGSFTAPASRIAAFDGGAWSPLGLGVNGRVNDMTLFDDDGPGTAPPALYIAGSFTLAGGDLARNIARWDGSTWSPVADTNNEALVITAADPDGTGPAPTTLIAGGWFTTIASTNANHLAHRTGADWLPFAEGLSGPFPVFAQTVTPFDPDGPPGAGPQPALLYIGGFFTGAGKKAALGFASWNGSAWAPVAGGIGHPAEARDALVHDDDGPGPNSTRLFVCGTFIDPPDGPGRKIAAWDGLAWSPLAAGMDLNVTALAAFDDDGPGPDPPALFAGGEFTIVDGRPIPFLARWGTLRTAPSPCPDANADGVVNFADITSILRHFGEVCSPPCDGDATRDGVVNFGDITAVLTAFGSSCD